MVDWGMTPAEAIRSATVTASECWESQTRLGRSKFGKLADIVGGAGRSAEGQSRFCRRWICDKGGLVYKGGRRTLSSGSLCHVLARSKKAGFATCTGNFRVVAPLGIAVAVLSSSV